MKYTTPALVCFEIGKPYQLEEVEIDVDLDRLEGQAIVQFEATGVCHTDVLIQLGIAPAVPPFIGGHEGSGRILHLPKSYTGQLEEGDAFISSFRSCQRCSSCRNAQSFKCDEWFAHQFFVPEPPERGSDGDKKEPSGWRKDHPNVLRGPSIKVKGGDYDGMAVHGDFFGCSTMMQIGIVDLLSITQVPKDLVAPPGNSREPTANGNSHRLLSPVQLCSFGCAVQTGIGTVTNFLLPGSLNPSPEEKAANASKSLAIFGAGPVGFAAIIGARLAGIGTIVVMDISPSKLSLARRAGADHVINPLDFTPVNKGLPFYPIQGSALVQHIRSLTPNVAGFTFSIEASGVDGVIDDAVSCLSIGGHCALVGVPPPTTTLRVSLGGALLPNQWRVSGVIEGHCEPKRDIPDLVRSYAHKRGQGQEWKVFEEIIGTYRPEEFGKAVQDAKSGKTVKSVIVWDS